MSEIQASLEWDSILKAVLDVDVRAALPGLDKTGVVAYTDGACIKNPGGPAGWSALLWAATDAIDGQLPVQARCVECYGHIPRSKTTTNNRAEISAVLAVLSIAPPVLPLTIYSDSEYTIKVATGAYQMKANPDLWEIYRKMLSYRKTPPKYIWVRGHAGHEHNERADYLAGLGAWDSNEEAFERWQQSQTPEARSGLSSAEISKIRKQVQQLQSYIDTIDPNSSRVSLQERKFIADMTKRLRKNTFVPSEKQSSWLQKLVVKYRL
ncbi:ribonuclease HI [Dictyobacter kobayashii]|uniref:ribonuclease HI n=1 Tax=Dictyobacter kobayashii TaxID=2014872 RepID=UPI0013868250|nr:RNase H family protein [Dictyobacter kobayashii]